MEFQEKKNIWFTLAIMSVCFVAVLFSTFFGTSPEIHAADHTITVTTTTDDIAADGACALREAIQAVNNGSTVNDCTLVGLTAGQEVEIRLSSLTTYILTQDGADDTNTLGDLDITNSTVTTTISKNGAGSNPSIQSAFVGDLERAIDIHSTSTVNINNIDFENFTTDNAEAGGAIRNNAAGTLNITNGTISMGQSAGSGGAISNASTGSIVITGTTFSGNNSLADGGAITNQSTGSVTVNNGTFTSNHAADDGGAIDSQNSSGTFIINNSSFTSNSSTSQGGAIYSGGTLTVATTTFTANTSTSAGGVASLLNASVSSTFTNVTITGNLANANGGVFQVAPNQYLTIASSTISNNQSTGVGGVVNASNPSTIIITSSTFSGNKTATASGGQGGAIYSPSVLTITDSTLTANKATTTGGAISMNGGTLTLTNATITNNTATTTGAGMYLLNTTFTITSSTFTGNVTADDGGAAYFDGASTGGTITNSIMSSNTSTSNGAAFHKNGAMNAITITSTTIDNNNAGSDGGAIRTTGGGVLTITGGTISGNTTTASGGAISMSSAGVLVLNSVTASNNVATNRGGFLSNNASTFTINTSTIQTNIATTGNGGAIYADGSSGTSTIINTTVSSNSSTVRGGGIYFAPTDGVLTITSSTLSSNIAGTDGGALSVPSGSSSSTITSSTFSSNTANTGGGIYVQATAEITVSNSTITKNMANAVGGGFSIDGSAIVNIQNNSVVSMNTSTNNGGGINQGSNNVLALNITNSTIQNNNAGTTGGGIHQQDPAATITITSSTLSNNVAATNGGAINNSSGAITITGTSTIANNTATGSDGGGLYDSAPEVVTISDGVTFSGNLAGRDGGAIFNEDGVAMIITSSTFSGNRAVNDGGAIINREEITITNATFSGNRADNGGAVFNETDGSTSTLNHVTLHLNIATTTAGGLYADDGTIFAQNTLIVNNTLAAGGLDNCGINAGNGGSISSNFGNLEYALGPPVSSDCSMGAGDIVTSTAIATIINNTLASNGGKNQTHALPTSSPAINAGFNTAVVLDQRGTARPSGSAKDVGAYEFTAFPTLTLTPASVTQAEGNAGNTNVAFTVTIPTTTGFAYSFDYRTVAQTAVSGTDFVGIATTTANVAAGTTSTAINLSIIGDQIAEANETLLFQVMNVINSTVQGAFGNIQAGVTITNDDGTAGATVNPTSGLTTTEAGGTATFSIVLDSQPTANVTVAIASSDTTEGTVSTSSILFTAANWNTAVIVTITGVNDTSIDGNVAYTITTNATSADPDYNGVTIADVSVTNTDDDSAVSSSSGGGGGGGIAPGIIAGPLQRISSSSGGGTNAPLVSINRGAATTDSRVVNITLHDNLLSQSITQMAVANNSKFRGVNIRSFQREFPWELSEGNGTKTVYVRFIAANGNKVETSASIVLESSNGVTVQNTTGPRRTTSNRTTRKRTAAPTRSVEEPRVTRSIQAGESEKRTCPVTTGQAYKVTGSPGIYFVSPHPQDPSLCVKRLFTQAHIFFSHEKTFRNVQPIAQETLTAIPYHPRNYMLLGPLYQPLSGTIVKSVDSSNIYVVVDSTRYPVSDGDTFEFLGYEWDWVEDVSPELIKSLSLGNMISGKEDRPVGSVVKYADAPTLYHLEYLDEAFGDKKGLRQIRALREIEETYRHRLDRIITIHPKEEYEIIE